MEMVFGFSVKKALDYRLSLEDLYILRILLDTIKNNECTPHKEKPEYFRVDYKTFLEKLLLLKRKNIRQLAKHLIHLSGLSKNSIASPYPLKRIVEIDNEKNNRVAYYAINNDVVANLETYEKLRFNGKLYSYTDEFILQYKKICAIYNFGHRMNPQAPTKLLLTAQTIIQGIINGEFTKKYRISPLYQTKYSNAYKRLESAIPFSTILDTIRVFADMLEENESSYLTEKITLPKFFYDDYNKKSFFLMCLDKITPIYSENDVEFCNDAESFINKINASYTNYEKIMAMNNLYKINLYYMKNYDKFKKKAYDTNKKIQWLKLFGVEYRLLFFLQEFYNYYKDVKREIDKLPKITLKLSVHCYFWHDFADYIEKYYNILILE